MNFRNGINIFITNSSIYVVFRQQQQWSAVLNTKHFEQNEVAKALFFETKPRLRPLFLAIQSQNMLMLSGFAWVQT